MQCKCGGDTRLNESVNKKLNASLEFYECKACGRISSAQLFIEDVLVADDPVSRHHYQHLDKSLAKQLVEEAKVISSVADQTLATPPLDQQSLDIHQTGSLF